MRWNRFAFALLIAPPLLAGAFARADETAPSPPKPAPLVPPSGADAPAKPATDAPKLDGTKPLDAKVGEAKKPATEIEWLHDYDEAKVRAADQKKGLFVYLTPSWFT